MGGVTRYIRNIIFSHLNFSKTIQPIYLGKSNGVCCMKKNTNHVLIPLIMEKKKMVTMATLKMIGETGASWAQF